jgi:hypothetical protein
MLRSMSRTITLSLSALVGGYILGRWLRRDPVTVIGAEPAALPNWAL